MTPSNSQLDRGLRALELLTQRSCSASDLAAALGVNRSTGLRLLEELRSLGYVRRDEQSKHYVIVPERFVPMASQDNHADWHETLSPVLKKVRDEVGESTLLATPAAGVMVYVMFFPSDQTVAVRERVGTLRPMHASALGKAWLSVLEDDRLDAELHRIDYSGGTERAPRNPHELRMRVEEAKLRGWATDIEESLEGVSCVAVPVRIDTIPVGAAAISAPSTRMSATQLERNGSLLAEALPPPPRAPSLSSPGRLPATTSP